MDAFLAVFCVFMSIVFFYIVSGLQRELDDLKARLDRAPVSYRKLREEI